MKKLIMAAAALMFVWTGGEASAQNLLKKIGKAVEKEVVNQLNSNSKQQSQPQQQKQQSQPAQQQSTAKQQSTAQSTAKQQSTTQNTAQSTAKQQSTTQSTTTRTAASSASSTITQADIYRNPYVLSAGSPGCEPMVLIDGIEYRLNRDTKTAAVESVGPSWKKKLTTVTIQTAIEFKDEVYPVVSILPRCFYGETLTAIKLPKTLQEIGDSAFKASKLKSVTIPPSVKYLGFAAFSQSALETVSLYEGLERLDDWVFSECTKLQVCDLPSSVTSMGQGTFNYCLKLRSVLFPRDIKSIPPSTFKNCKALTKFPIIGKVVEIGAEAFRGSGLQTVFIPAGVHTLGNEAYAECQQMTKLVVPSTITKMGDKVFVGCHALQSVQIHNKHKNYATATKMFGTDAPFVTGKDPGSWRGFKWND